MKNETVKKQKVKVSKFIADAEAQAKAKSVLQNLLEKVKAKEVQNPALAIVKEQINVIDELQKNGATLAQIYEHLNNEIKFGITAASFTQYVRSVRKETGSSMLKKYKPRAKKSEVVDKSSEQAPAISSDVEVNKDNSASNITINQNEKKIDIADEEKWNCTECKTKSTRIESKARAGIFYWQCQACKTFYADKNNELSNEVLNANKKD